MFQRGAQSRRRVWGVWGLLIQLLWLGPANAEPLDLGDRQPRPVLVRFEVSPRELPQQTGSTYTPSLPAMLTPGVREGEAQVTVAGSLVEEHLMDRQNPVVGSFSDFVWTFDIETGHVLSAHFAGTVVRHLRWGFMTTRTLADIDVEMHTARDSGFRSPVNLLGQLFFRHCSDDHDAGCTIVRSRSYDSETGYVNAGGIVGIKSSVMKLRGFSPLGEAIFSEVERSVLTHADPAGSAYEQRASIQAEGRYPSAGPARLASDTQDVN